MSALLAALALVLTGPDLTYAWNPPPGNPVDRYEVLVIQQGQPQQLLETTGTSLTFRPLMGLTTVLRVRACVTDACGEWSDGSQRVSANLSADFNGDGIVGLPDLPVLAGQVGNPGSADLTGDGLVGLSDVHEWTRRVGQCIGPVSVDDVLLEAYLPCELVRP